MKKITFLAFLLVSGISQAQTYCEINEDFVDVEEITSVAFGTTTLPNTNTTSILVDLTSTLVNVNVNQTYSLTVQGNSHGDFDNEYVAYIDWNHNGVLNDAGEMFYIGMITDSDGNDGQTATVNIPVPATALTGNTRIRIVKVYTDQSDDYILNPDPCYISIEDVFFGSPGDIEGSYGQALDFTLNVADLGLSSLDAKALKVYPIPVKDVLNINYKSDIKTVKIYNLLGQEVLSKAINSSDFQLDVKNISTGTYVIKLTTDKGQQTLKLVKE